MLDQARTRLLGATRSAEFDDTGIVIHRALTLADPEEFLERLANESSRAGKYWSFTASRARPYWGSGGRRTCVLTGTAPLDSIDFAQTVRAHLAGTLSADEDEVALVPGKRVHLTGAIIDGKTRQLDVDALA